MEKNIALIVGGFDKISKNILDICVKPIDSLPIKEVEISKIIVRPGILPKKGGKKNKNVYYGRRY